MQKYLMMIYQAAFSEYGYGFHERGTMLSLTDMIKLRANLDPSFSLTEFAISHLQFM